MHLTAEEGTRSENYPGSPEPKSGLGDDTGNALALDGSSWWNRWLVEGWINAGAVASAQTM